MDVYSEIIAVLKQYAAETTDNRPITPQELSRLVRERNLCLYAAGAQTEELADRLRALVADVLKIMRADPEAAKRMRIRTVTDIDSLLMIILKLLSCVRGHLVEIDRENGEMKGVLKRLNADLSRITLLATAAKRAVAKLAGGGEDVIRRELEVMGREVCDEIDIDELKRKVSEALGRLEKTLDEQQAARKARLLDLYRRLEGLQSGVISVQDVVQAASKHEAEIQRLKGELFKDELTGLGNRRMMEEALKRYDEERDYGLLMIDLDDFKQVNDTYGHDAGDRCLQEVGRRIKSALRETDIAVRYGGDEFVVILPHTDLDGARIVAERIRDAIQKTRFLWNGNEFRVGASIGVTVPKDIDYHWCDVVKRADSALYEAKKRKGTIGVRVLPPTVSGTVSECAFEGGVS